MFSNTLQRRIKGELTTEAREIAVAGIRNITASQAVVSKIRKGDGVLPRIRQLADSALRMMGDQSILQLSDWPAYIRDTLEDLRVGDFGSTPSRLANYLATLMDSMDGEEISAEYLPQLIAVTALSLTDKDLSPEDLAAIEFDKKKT
ncbi:MAG: hypothetical protein NT094_05725 [Candidatus Staskawiczbacteria bacterium]|nr:hypothetical protein [Candidatus Staskawiczbacteria bacterium]